MPESVGLAWYSTGTVTLVQGSTAVIGVGTNWKNAGLKVGDIFTIDRVTLYMIASVNSNTSITLLQAYAGNSGNTMNYYVIRNFAATLQAELSAQVSQLVGDYESWKDGRVNEIAIPFDFSSLYKGVWATGRSYKALDIVMYNSALYVCSLAHTSASGNTPGTAGSLNYWVSYAPAMPASIDVLNYNNAGTHNALPRGKNLGTAFTDAQSAAIRAGTFNDIYVCDYWNFTNVPYTYYGETSDTTAQSGKTYYADATGTELETQPETGTDISEAGYFEKRNSTYSGTMRWADCDFFLKSGTTPLNAHHGVVVPDAVLFQSVMNPKQTAEGGYSRSKMRTVYMKRAEAIFKACFGESHVLKHQEYLVNAVTNGNATGGSWYDSYCELMDECMVFGSLIYNSACSVNGSYYERRSIVSKQLNLFRHRPDLISNRQWFWLRNVVNASHFSTVTDVGLNNELFANNSYCGVRPYALIY